jgi:hypothetical protein
MTFACPRCGYESDTRFNMRRHLTRTKACTPIDAQHNIGSDDALRMFQRKVNEEKRTYKCKHCDKAFTDSSNKCRHAKICDENPQNKEKITVSKNQLESIIEDMVNKIQTKGMQCNNITVNQNNTFNIQINISGKESMDHITSEKLTEYLLENNVVELLRDINFNPQKPENHSVKRISKSKKFHKNLFMKIYDENGWKYDRAIEILKKKISHCVNVLAKHKIELLETKQIEPHDDPDITIRLGANLDDDGIITRAFALALDDRFVDIASV